MDVCFWDNILSHHPFTWPYEGRPSLCLKKLTGLFDQHWVKVFFLHWRFLFQKKSQFCPGQFLPFGSLTHDGYHEQAFWFQSLCLDARLTEFMNLRFQLSGWCIKHFERRDSAKEVLSPGQFLAGSIFSLKDLNSHLTYKDKTLKYHVSSHY